MDFDPERLKKYYDEKFEKGKELAQDLREKQEKKEHDADVVHIVDKLKELAKMKEDGIITAEEFEKMKKKMIDE